MASVMSKSKFKTLNAFQKGYVCYLYGSNKDQPNVPKTWTFKYPRHGRLFQDGREAAAEMLPVLHK